MEGKKLKLNLNQPLLSVRKYSTNMTSRTAEETKTRPVIPLTPPHRSELKSGPVGNPGAVPFQWEQIPGRPKEEMKKRQDSLTGSFMDVKMHDYERSEEKTEENKDSSSEGRDEAYIEAIESFLLHCGTNGNFSLDPKTREFIKDKFLPRYASKKQSPVREGEKGEDDCDQHINLPAVCCLLPRFCLKSSLCVLNPVPVMNMRTQVLTSPAARIQPQSSLANEVKTVGKSLKNERNRLKSHDTTDFEDKDVFALPGETGIEGLKTFQELLADECHSTELDSGSSPAEKTVHVANVEKAESIRCCSVNTQDTEINTKGTDKDSSYDDFKKILSSIDKKNGTWRMETSKGFRENLDCKQDSTTKENIDVFAKQARSTLENCHENYSDFPVLPPLRSPSDSWLRRALPSNLSSAPNPRYGKAISSGKLRLNRKKV